MAIKLIIGGLMCVIALFQIGDTHFTNSTNLGQLVLLITFILNMLIQWLRERRQRQWALEDAARVKTELAEHEARMKAELAKRAEEIKAASRTRITDLGSQLDSLINTGGPDDRRKPE